MYNIAKLAFQRSQSQESYRELQKYIVTRTVEELRSRDVNLNELDVLELACGAGGYSTVLNEHSKTFLASDIKKDDIFNRTNLNFQFIDVMKEWPLDESSIDLIYCSSIIEHIPDPKFLLKECRKVLRPGGFLFLSFPPFYSLSMIGGHNFKPFHFLGERFAVFITNLYTGGNVRDYATCYGEFGLYPLTIGRVKELILTSGFTLSDTYCRLSPINTARFPGFLKDLFTWHVCFLAENGLNPTKSKSSIGDVS
jgi:SAM-dependent methyltransferase